MTNLLTWKAYLAIAAAILLIGLGAFGAWKWRGHQLEVARAQAASAAAHAALSDATVQITDQTAARETVIHSQAEVSTDAVRKADGATTPLPPAVGASVRDGIGKLRQRPAAVGNHGSR